MESKDFNNFSGETLTDLLKRNLNYKFLFIFIVFLGCIYFAYLYIAPKFSFYAEKSQYQIPAKDVVDSLDKGINNFKNRFGSTTLEVKSSSVLNFEKLPSSLKFMVPKEQSASIQASDIIFSNNSRGYKVSFIYPGSALSTFKDFRGMTLSQYDFIKGISSRQSAVLILENSQYIFNINIIARDVGAAEVTILALTKNL